MAEGRPLLSLPSSSSASESLSLDSQPPLLQWHTQHRLEVPPGSHADAHVESETGAYSVTCMRRCDEQEN